MLRNDPDFAFWTSGPGIFRRGADWTDAAPIATGQEPQGLALAELGQCKNDLVFCNGKEICFDGKCSHVGNPCGTDSLCDEEAKRCVCTSATGCASPLHCDVSTGNCVECLNDQDCNDGDFCDPLTAECVACLIDEHCDDGDYCNGLETCLDQTCVAGQSPCADGETCLPAENACVIVLLDCETPLDPARIVHQGAAEPPKCTSAEPPELPGSVLEFSWSFAETEGDAFIVLVFDEVSVAPGDRITLDIVVEDQQTVRFEMKTAGMQTICATSRQFEQSTTYTMEFDVCTPMNIAELGLVIESDPGVQVVSQSRFWIDNVQIRR